MYLGLDLGTSELKAVLLDERHAIVGVAHAPLLLEHPRPLWAEQHPQQWWQALEQVMDRLHSEHPQALARLQAVGLAGQMHGAVTLDARGEVIRPAILWNDGRSADECVELMRRVPSLPALTGNLAMPGFTAPKLLWMQRHEPAQFDRVAHVLLPKDWLRWKLCGQRVSDMSDASGTLWLDTARRDWCDALLAATGLSRAHMPALVEGSQISATVLPAWCDRWGLPRGVRVAGGAGDNAASAVGMGVVRAGQGFVSLGSSGVVFLCTAGFAPRPERAVHAFCHALPRQWHQMAVMLSAASALTWAARVLGYASEAEALREAAALEPARAQRAPLFLPYLNGERSPHNDPHAQGVWFGLTASHTRADLIYAVAEGVAFGLRDGWLTLDRPEADAPACLSLVGGGSRSLWWAQLLADVLGVELQLHEGGHTGAALGAARLAWLSVGASVSDVCQTPPVRQVVRPDSIRSADVMERHARFVQLYAQVRAQWAAQAPAKT
ncbi:xylulokinase [Caldimonas manganoxidans]|uniref:xylulokinase n=1 Tax=Caldimonas manganoxidans TaxID=196015 RepID=UPI00036E37D4|nr:xylulokinase [Caldimonas manganoxidans]